MWHEIGVGIAQIRARQGIASPLSISAPGAYVFADGDQPISLYKYGINNLAVYSEDISQSQWGAVNATRSDVDTWTPDNASPVTAATHLIQDSFYITDTVGTLGTVVEAEFLAAGITQIFFQDGLGSGVIVNLSAGSIVSAFGSATNESIASAGGGYYRVAFRTPNNSPAFFMYSFAGQTHDGVNGVKVRKLSVREVSSPSTYVQTTSAAFLPVASGHDHIQFADSEDTGGDYTLAMSLTNSGTIDFDNTAYSALTENSGGDGTGTIDVTGTVVELNALFLPTAAQLDDFTTGTGRTISITFTRDADGKSVSKVISVSNYATLDIDTYLPVDNATDVSSVADIVATFNAPIQYGTGNVVLYDVNGAAANETFDVFTAVGGVVSGDNGGTLTISGANLTINPGDSPLAGSNEFAMQIAATAIDIENLASASFAGITGTIAWSFTTIADSSLTLTEQTDGYIYQRTKGTTARTITIAGTYVDGYPALTAVEAAIRRVSDNSIVTAWTTVDASLAGGTWSGSISVPQGGAYYVDVRDTIETAVGDTDTKEFFVGMWAIVYGQSVAFRMYDDFTAPTPSEGTGWLDVNTELFSKTPEGEGVGHLANEIKRLIGLPCAVVAHGASAASIETLIEEQPDYITLTDRIDDADGDAELLILMHGQSSVSMAEATYIGHANAIHASIAAHVGRTRAQIPMLVHGLLRHTVGGEDDDDYGTFRETQVALAAQHDDIYYSHTSIDVPLADNIHPTEAGFTTISERLAYSYAYLEGLESSPASFFMATSADYVSATKTRIDVVHGSGTDFTFDGASTGFEVWDGVSAWVAATGARIDANTIELNHSSIGGNGRKVGYMRGAGPTITGAVRDNSDINGTGAPLVPNHTGIDQADTVAPTISSSVPADDATGIVVDANIVITFDENIQFITSAGTFILRDNDGGFAHLEVFTPSSTSAATGAGGGSASISGAVLTINPGADFADTTEHAMRFASNVIEDAAGNDFAGIADDTTLSWTSGVASAAATYIDEGDQVLSGSGTNFTGTVTSTGDNTLVCLSWEDSGDDITSATLDGNAMTILTDTVTNRGVAILGIAGNVTAKTLSVNWDNDPTGGGATGDPQATVLSVGNIDSLTPEDSQYKYLGGSNTVIDLDTLSASADSGGISIGIALNRSQTATFFWNIGDDLGDYAGNGGQTHSVVVFEGQIGSDLTATTDVGSNLAIAGVTLT